MIKKSSKITILASLLIASTINAQEFYTCVPKKSWWKDTMGESIRNNVPSADSLAEAVAKGMKSLQKKDEWQLITRIDFSKILNDSNLNSQNLVVGDSFLLPGNYKFKLLLKNESGVLLGSFITITTLNNNEKLFCFEILSYNCMNDNQNRIREFLEKYDLDTLKFVQNRNLIDLPTCKPDYNIGIGLLRIGNVALFSYEHISSWSGGKLYDENFIVNERVNDNNYRWLSKNPLNIFRYSTLEVYKQE